MRNDRLQVDAMNDENQIQLLKDAIRAYENGEIFEAKDKAIKFINNITDFEAESEEQICIILTTYGGYMIKEKLTTIVVGYTNYHHFRCGANYCADVERRQ